MRFNLTTQDEIYMREALDLAKLGRGWVDPNPLVGCVIVKDGRIIGRGYHRRFGYPHAEREALANCIGSGNDPKGAWIYVTLEPCSHYGKTPPCVDALIEAEVGKVVIGSNDPNPLVAGSGISALQNAGIDVACGVLKDECDLLNEVFFHYISTNRPFVVAKYSMALDGKIATHTKRPLSITGAEAREQVHIERATYASIMVGVNTVIADDPSLNARSSALISPVQIKGSSNGASIQETMDINTPFEDLHQLDLHQSDLPQLDFQQLDLYQPDLHQSDLHQPNLHQPDLHQPVRIICDTDLRTPLDSKVVLTANEQRTIIATCIDFQEEWAPYIDAGCEVIQVEAVVDSEDSAKRRIDLDDLLDKIGKLGLDSIYVEGGSTLFGSLFDQKSIDRLIAYISTELVCGGEKAPSPIGGVGASSADDAIRLDSPKLDVLGNDIRISGRVAYA